MEIMSGKELILLLLLALLLAFLLIPMGYIITKSFLRTIPEYERAVIFRFGRLVGIRGPGLIFVIPIIEKAKVLDLRLRVIEIPRQDVMTADNVPVYTNAICFYRVNEPQKAIVEVENYEEAVFQLAQATTRTAFGESHLDEILAHRDELNERIRSVVDEFVHRWGISVDAVEIKDVEVPDTMKRAIARQAEAERTKRGRLIEAEGEEIAAELLAEASAILEAHPEGMYLRTLQGLTEVGAEAETRTVVLLPVDLLKNFSSEYLESEGEKQ